MQLKRYLEGSLRDLCFADHKMAFLSGPRQCGKTTFARMMLDARGRGAYYNWDDVEFRKQWTLHPRQTLLRGGSKAAPLVAYDEIHKAHGWKRTLKGIYDTREHPVDIVVTGSARLNVFMKGGDSLVGRYYHFRMHPFTIGELFRPVPPGPETLISRLRGRSIGIKKEHRERYDGMLKYGAFPEPLLAQDERKARLWRSTRIERVVREDLRDLSRIPELSRIEMLCSLLPDRVGSPLSINSLREDLEVSHETVCRWLDYLKVLYYAFEIKPYHRSVARSLKKEGKFYLWDFGEIRNPGPRFENFVAVHLLKSCDFWTDAGFGVFDLHYLRNKEKQEIDFLITRDGEPLLAVEAKLADASPSPHWNKFLHQTGCQTGLQIVGVPGVWKKDGPLITASADEALLYFV